MKKHKPTAADIIRSRAALSGLTGEQVRIRTGISKGTWSRRMQSGIWRTAELKAIDDVIHLTDEDIIKITRG